VARSRSLKGATNIGTLAGHFRSVGSTLMHRVQQRDQITNKETGIRLNLLTKYGDIDRRVFNTKALRQYKPSKEILQQMKNYESSYMQFLAEVTKMQQQFGLSLYLRLTNAYRGAGNRTKLRPLARKTIYKRKSYGYSGTTPYYESGSFAKEGIRYDKETSTVYISKATHPQTRTNAKGEELTQDITYIEIYMINEFGRKDKMIPARPVFRPILAELLVEYEQKLIKAVKEHLS
jgi:hypothetical protein